MNATLPWLKTGQNRRSHRAVRAGEDLSRRKSNWTAGDPFADADFDGTSDSTKMRAEISNPPVEAGELGARQIVHRTLRRGPRRRRNRRMYSTVPRSAVLQPGSQPVVYVDLGQRILRAAQNQTGPRRR